MVISLKHKHPDEIAAWLQSGPSLGDLAASYPELREAVRLELAEIIARGAEKEFPEHLKRMAHKERLLEKKLHGNFADRKLTAELIHLKIHHRMAHLAIKQHLISEATGITQGKVRLNWFNAYMAQLLLFSHGLERKPVSLLLFRLLWPLIWQKRLLMPLVQPKGIYCFYSRQLIDELAKIIGTRSCLEVAAGDGTLSKFLADSGVTITATDDYSWQSEVTYTDFVVKMAAATAVRTYKPETVICSWPPAGNSFEQQIFRSGSVQLYIVIGSRHHFAAGNWDAYLEQSHFDPEENERLSRLVLPPELDAAVYLFRRKQPENL